MEHDFLSRSGGKFPVVTEHLKRQSCFSERNAPNGKFVFHFFKAISDTIFRPSWPFFGNWILFVQMLNARNGARKEKKRPTKDELGEYHL